MSGVRAEAQEAGCRIPGGQVGGEFITLSNQKRFPTPLFRPSRNKAGWDFVSTRLRGAWDQSLPRLPERPVRAPPSGSLRTFLRGLGQFPLPISAEPRRGPAPPAPPALRPSPAPRCKVKQRPYPSAFSPDLVCITLLMISSLP